MNNNILYQGTGGECFIYILHYMDAEPYDPSKSAGIVKMIMEKCTAVGAQYSNYIKAVDTYHLETISTEQGLYHRDVAVITVKQHHRRDYFAPRGGELPTGFTHNGTIYATPRAIVVNAVTQGLTCDRYVYTTPEYQMCPTIMYNTLLEKRQKDIEAIGVYTTTWDNYDEEYSRIIVKLHKNAAEMLNDKTKLWTHGYLTTMDDGGIHTNRWNAPTKYKAFYMGNTLIVSDNKNGLNDIMPQLQQVVSLNSDLKLVNVNQYSVFDAKRGNVTLGMIRGSGRIGESILDLGFLVRNQMKDITRTSPSGGMFNGRPGPDAVRIRLKYTLMVQGRGCEYSMETLFAPQLCTQTNNRLILPYEPEKDLHIQALDYYLAFARREISIDDFCDQYMTLLTPLTAETDSDVLDQWFTMCSANSNREQEQLLQSYKTLKKRLMIEYKRAGIYLQHNDMKQKAPIPAVKIKGDALSKNIDSKLSVDFMNQEYYDFGRERLKTPIVDRTMIVKYSIPMRNYVGCRRMGSTEISRLYDKATNTVVIDTARLYANDERKVRGEC